MAAAKKAVRGTKAGPATPVTIVPALDDISPYDKAVAMSQDPAMVVGNDNPLADDTPEEATAMRIQDYNMDRLYQDARLRRKPGTGGVYAGFMANRFGG